MLISEAVTIIENEIPESEYYSIEVKYIRYGHTKPMILYNIYSQTRGHNEGKTLLEALELFQNTSAASKDEVEVRNEELEGLVKE